MSKCYFVLVLVILSSMAAAQPVPQPPVPSSSSLEDWYAKYLVKREYGQWDLDTTVGTGTASSFFDVEVKNGSNVFVIDRSGSMYCSSYLGRAVSRWQLATTELRDVIGALPLDASSQGGGRQALGMVFFSDKVRSEFRLRKVTSQTKSQAYQTIAANHPSGCTNYYAGLSKAVEWLQHDSTKANKTIYFLGDGQPNRGPYQEVPRYKTVPVYKAVPVYKTVPVYKRVPVYKTVPVYRTVPIYKKVPVYKNVPVYKTVPIYKKVPIYRYIRIPGLHWCFHVMVGFKNIKVGYKKIKVGYKKIRIGTKKIRVGSKRIQIGTRRVRAGSRKILVGTRKIKIGTKKILVGTRKIKYGTTRDYWQPLYNLVQTAHQQYGIVVNVIYCGSKSSSTENKMRQLAQAGQGQYTGIPAGN